MEALLLIHFGTTHADTREKTIDAFRKRLESLHPELDVFEAFTSRMILKKLKKQGLDYKNPLEVLEELKEKGYKKVYVQTSHILHGLEFDNLRDEMLSYAPAFEKISLGAPLLEEVEDYKKLAKILVEREKGGAEALVYVGHGSRHSANASYALLRYVFTHEGHEDYFVGTVEGYPELGEVLEDLEKHYGERKPKLCLKPLMFVAGEHAKKDIAGDWKEALEAKGYEVTAILEGLGEIPEVQDIFLEHLEEARKNKPSMAEYKKTLA